MKAIQISKRTDIIILVTLIALHLAVLIFTKVRPPKLKVSAPKIGGGA